MRISRIVVAAAACALGGCAAFRVSDIEPIRQSELSKVLDEAKRQISIYELRSRSVVPGQKYGESIEQARQRRFWCGRGLTNFEIKSVQLELTTELDSTFEGGISASGAAASVPVSGSAGFGVTSSNSQELKYTLYPVNWSGLQMSHIQGADLRAPIADVLTNLRNASIDSAQTPGDCFYNLPAKGEKGEANTYKIGLKIINASSISVGLGVAPVDVKASVSNKSTTGNTMTVTFAQTTAKLPAPRPPRDRDPRGPVCTDDRPCLQGY